VGLSEIIDGQPPGSTPLGIYNANALSNPAIVSGWMDPLASAVEVTTDAGLVLRATIDRGYWLAWWPGPDQPILVQSLDGGGSVLEEIRPDTLPFEDAP